MYAPDCTCLHGQGGLRLPGCCTLAAPCYQTALGEQWGAVLYLGLQSTAPRSLKSLAISAHSVSRPLMIATVVSTSPCPRALSTPCRHPCNHAPRQLCWLTRQGHACEREAQTAGMLAERAGRAPSIGMRIPPMPGIIMPGITRPGMPMPGIMGIMPGGIGIPAGMP